MQWLDETNTVVRQETLVQELLLDLLVTADHNNSRYTCRVDDGGFVETYTITTIARGTAGADPEMGL